MVTFLYEWTLTQTTVKGEWKGTNNYSGCITLCPFSSSTGLLMPSLIVSRLKRHMRIVCTPLIVSATIGNGVSEPAPTLLDREPKSSALKNWGNEYVAHLMHIFVCTTPSEMSSTPTNQCSVCLDPRSEFWVDSVFTGTMLGVFAYGEFHNS